MDIFRERRKRLQNWLLQNTNNNNSYQLYYPLCFNRYRRMYNKTMPAKLQKYPWKFSMFVQSGIQSWPEKLDKMLRWVTTNVSSSSSLQFGKLAERYQHQYLSLWPLSPMNEWNEWTFILKAPLRSSSDIDECKMNPCEQNCKNNAGSFQCSCRVGYKIDPKNSTKCLGE